MEKVGLSPFFGIKMKCIVITSYKSISNILFRERCGCFEKKIAHDVDYAQAGVRR